MDEILQQFDKLTIDYLQHDVQLIIKSCNMQLPCLDLSSLLYKPHNSYTNEMLLYQQITRMITCMGHASSLLELMPYIDDYIEHIFG